MTSLIRQIYTRIFIDGICDLFWTFELSQGERESIAKVNKWRCGQLHQDDALLDSDKRFLLLAAANRLFLVEREGAWKRELDERDLDLYCRRGRAAFGKIRKRTRAN